LAFDPERRTYVVLALVAPVPVHVPSDGLPVWQQALLTVLGCVIAFGILYGIYRLLPKSWRNPPKKK
jgi:hypothetical protein